MDRVCGFFFYPLPECFLVEAPIDVPNRIIDKNSRKPYEVRPGNSILVLH